MSDRKIVDDYYSQIKEDKEENIEQKSKPTLLKKKLVIKKASKDEIIEDNSIKKTTSKVEIKKEWKIDKKPKIVQKIEVVKREFKKPDFKKPEFKKQGNFNKSSSSVVKLSENNKKDIKSKDWGFKWDFSKNKNGNNTNNSNSNNNIKTNFKQKKEKFFNEEAEKLNKNKDKSKVKDKSKTRWKFHIFEEEEVTFVRSNKLQKTKKQEKHVEDIKQNLVEKRWETIIVWDFLSVKELSEKIWITLPKLIAEFMKNWMMVNINSKIDFETASIVSEAFDIKLERDNSSWAKVEDILLGDISSLLHEDDNSKLIPRPPVISIMWHVDHGKTSLLDYIRKSKVAFGEAGWITQSIWAYQVELDTGNITFLDTPWHEAFTIMRARWAKSTDIAILVVAADEWVKPQTLESISHAREAHIPIIVAINKMDKEWANPDHVKWQLAEQWLVAEDWGGDIPMIPVSAHTWFWIDELLEMILLVAEMKELKANPDRNWIATVIESHLDNNLWPVATMLVNTWIINSWDNIVCAGSHWKVKVLKNYLNQKVKFARPGDPILVVWLDRVVEWWDILQVVSWPEIAKNKVLEYKTILEKQKKSWSSWLELLMSKIKSWTLKQLKIILKADSNWSLEAIKNALQKLSTEDTEVSVIHAWVWWITEGDIVMTQWSDTILVWFWVWVLPTAKWSLESANIQFISSDIIYHITEKIWKIISWMLNPKEVEVTLWRAKIGWIFFTEKKFMIVGLIIPPESKVENGALVRILRKKQMIWTWKIDSLKEWTLEVKEVEWPKECWIKLSTNTKVEVWDELDIYKIEIQK